MDDHDDLIRRLRQRATDPERRVDGPAAAVVEASDATDAFVHLGRLPADLATVPPGPELRQTAFSDGLESVGIVLGVSLPTVLRRALREIADGGFGPGYGLFGTAELVRMTARCRRDAETLGRRWPTGRLAIADLGGGALACVDTDRPDAPVVIIGGQADEVPASPSLVTWLDEWSRSEVAAAG